MGVQTSWWVIGNEEKTLFCSYKSVFSMQELSEAVIYRSQANAERNLKRLKDDDYYGKSIKDLKVHLVTVRVV